MCSIFYLEYSLSVFSGGTARWFMFKAEVHNWEIIGGAKLQESFLSFEILVFGKIMSTQICIFFLMCIKVTMRHIFPPPLNIIDFRLQNSMKVIKIICINTSIIMSRHQSGYPTSVLYLQQLSAGTQGQIPIGTELLYVGSNWPSCLCSSMWRGPQEYVTYKFVCTSSVVSIIDLYMFKWAQTLTVSVKISLKFILGFMSFFFFPE